MAAALISRSIPMRLVSLALGILGSELASEAGVSNPKLSSVPNVIWNLIALFNPLMRALKETAYQMQRPYILDDSAARETFGMQPTPWNQILNDVVAEMKASLKK